jgi:transposase
MALLGKIRRMFYRDKLSLSEIARRTSLSRNTIKKWLRTPEGVEPKYRRQRNEHKLAPYVERLTKALEVDAHRPKRERRTALRLWKDICAEGFTGSYSRVTAFVRRWREHAGQTAGKAAYIPLKFALGEAFQFDWSEEGLVIGGIYRRLQVAHLKLCASRAFVLVAYPSQGHEMLFDAHTRSFAALGGIPRRGIYDNMKTAVDKVNKGKGRIVNARFAALASHYLFDTDFCNVASGWEKGVVEKNVQDSRRRIWQDAGGRRFGSFLELNLWLLERCRTLWQEIRHPEYAALSVAEMLDHERPHLMPMPAPFDGYVESVHKVSSTSLVAVARNRYSVPCESAGQRVSARLYPERIDIVQGDTVIASHLRLANHSQIRYDWQHYVPLLERKPGALRNGAPFADLPEPLQRLRHGLLKREGGDRVMARVLASVPQHGLEAVLVAVELVLESGVLSAEHVENVLLRIRHPVTPFVTIETDLTLVEAPLADPHRYDALREQEAGHA